MQVKQYEIFHLINTGHMSNHHLPHPFKPINLLIYMYITLYEQFQDLNRPVYVSGLTSQIFFVYFTNFVPFHVCTLQTWCTTLLRSQAGARQLCEYQVNQIPTCNGNKCGYISDICGTNFRFYADVNLVLDILPLVLFRRNFYLYTQINFRKCDN